MSFHSSSYLLAASAYNLRPDQPATQSNPSDPLSRRPQVGRHGNPEVQMNAQGGEILNEEELNRDWLDWVYTFSRAAILLSIVYFYSSFSRFVMVMMAMLVLYLWVICLSHLCMSPCVAVRYIEVGFKMVFLNGSHLQCVKDMIL